MEYIVPSHLSFRFNSPLSLLGSEKKFIIFIQKKYKKGADQFCKNKFLLKVVTCGFKDNIQCVKFKIIRFSKKFNEFMD